MRRPLGSDPEAGHGEVRFGDRLKHDLRGGHHHPVSHGGDAERSGLTRPSGLGICTRRNGAGRYDPVVNAAASCWRKSLTPPATTSSTVTPSTPGAPRFARTSSQARHMMSLRATWV